MKTAILPSLPIVGSLKLSSKDGKALYSIEVVKSKGTMPHDPFFKDCYVKLFSFLSGETNKIDIKLDLSACTPFQWEVLKAMKTIPYGKTATYKDLAVKMDSKAYQAIGSACGRNPWLLIYPCHRILGTNNMGGFAHGLKMKEELLKLESIYKG